MVNYRFLNDTDRHAVYGAFLAAFSDYQVDMKMTPGEFDYRLLRDGIDLTKSVGAFHHDEMIGFCLNGVGPWKGLQTVYDAGTGIVPGFRGQGIAKELFNFMLPRFRERFDQYLLEVITTNEPAVNLYRKLGFEHTRKLAVFRSKRQLEAETSDTGAELREVLDGNWSLYQTFWDGYPSWQNSVEAAQRTATMNVLLEAHVDGRCVGYGVVSKTSGNILQLAIVKRYRRRRLGSLLIRELQQRITRELRITNIDETLRGCLAFCYASGFEFVLEQYEMRKQL